MLISKLTSSFNTPLWIDDVPSLLNLRDRYSPSIGEQKKLISSVETACAEGRRGRALNWMTLGLVCGGVGFLQRVKDRGLLRPSRFRFDPGVPGFIAQRLLDAAEPLEFERPLVSYLESIAALARFAVHAQTLHKQVIRSLRKNPWTFLRTLLAHIEYLFLCKSIDRTEDLPEESIEYLAEGFSYLYFFVASFLSGQPLRPMAIVEPELIRDGRSLELLRQAAALRAFSECEILVDVMSYRCSYEKQTRCLTVSPQNRRAESAVRLGHIFREMGFLHVGSRDDKDDPAPSLRDAGFALADRLGDRIVRQVAKPVRRFIVEWPFELLEEYLKKDVLYFEEVREVEDATRQHLVEAKELLEYEVLDGVTFWDVLKLQRIASLMRWVVIRRLEPFIRYGDDELVLNSLLPVFTKESSRGVLSVLGPPEKVDKLLELLTWNLERGGVFDIQYQPIVDIGQEQHWPLNIIASSDLFRNTLILRRERVSDRKEEHPMNGLLQREFRKQGWECEIEVEYAWADGAGDVDVLCLRDDVLFAFETKFSLLPTSSFELRKTFDNLQKAADQLDRIKRFLDNDQNATDLVRRFGWTANTKNLRVETCIVLSNAMYPGLRVGGHPVRALLEVLSYLRGGKLRFLEGSMSLRATSELTTADLVAYLSGDRLQQVYEACMEPGTREARIGEGTIAFETFFLDGVELGRQFGLDLADRPEEELKKIFGNAAVDALPNLPAG